MSLPRQFSPKGERDLVKKKIVSQGRKGLGEKKKKMSPKGEGDLVKKKKKKKKKIVTRGKGTL